MLLKWLAGRRRPTGTPAARLERARALRLQDDFEGSRAAAQEILRDEPGHAGAWP